MIAEKLTEPSRSHRRLLKDIDKAAEKRLHLLDEQKFSLPSGEGKLAIIVSRVPDYRTKNVSAEQQHKAFLEEAYRLQQQRLSDHQEVMIRPIAVVGDMKFDFGDPEVTDIIMIGHGCISSMWADGGRYFDWHDAAKATSFLKQGKIEQRMCGNLPSKKSKTNELGILATEELPHKYSVPLGTFAVRELVNVTAATGMSIPDVDPSDELFRPIFSATHISVPEQIQVFNETYANTLTHIITT